MSSAMISAGRPRSGRTCSTVASTGPLTLIDPVALRPWGIGFDRAVRGHEGAFSSVSQDIHAAIVATYIRGAIRRAIPDDELGPYLRPWLGEMGQAAFYRQMGQFDMRFTDEIETRYGEVRCPTLILWGDEDRWLPIEHGRRLKTLIPSAAFRPVAGSGHLVQEDAPEAIVATLLDVLGIGEPRFRRLRELADRVGARSRN
jgi:pimeloyl-ACP methyl ester carboxylesterase